MPLRDHFHGRLGKERRWEGFHSIWTASIVRQLGPLLAPRYLAEPNVHLGVSVEADVAALEPERAPGARGGGNGVATEVWAPPQPWVSVATTLPAQDVFEVLVRDQERGMRLVAAIEMVSPRNKDRADSRQAFVRKCASYLQEQVAVVVVDVVTSRLHNLHNELMQALEVDEGEARLEDGAPFAVSYRTDKVGPAWRLDMWKGPVTVGAALPTLPLWLAADLAVPLELESSYEDAAGVLRIE